MSGTPPHTPFAPPYTHSYNYAFHLECLRHARDVQWWAKVSPDTWRAWLVTHGWGHVEGKFYSGPEVELWRHSSELDSNNRNEDRQDELKITGMPAHSRWADYGRVVFSCVEQALGETSSWHRYVRASRIGDVLFELLSKERAFAACVCVIDLDPDIELSDIWSLTTKDGASLVGGKLEPGETSLAAALRELFEESGAKLLECKRFYLYRTLDSENEIVDTFVFNADDVHLYGSLAGNGREGEPGWNTLSELAKHVRYGEYNQRLIDFIRRTEWR